MCQYAEETTQEPNQSFCWHKNAFKNLIKYSILSDHFPKTVVEMLGTQSKCCKSLREKSE